MLEIAFIENFEPDAVLIQEYLKQADAFPMHCTWFKDLDSALEAMKTQSFAVILTSLSFPNHQDLETVYALLKQAQEVPVIVLSRTQEQDLSVDCIKAGVQDYLFKDKLTSYTLSRAIAYAIERKTLLEALQKTALHDTLTHLPNRTLFLDRLEHAFERAKRYPKYQFALLFIDLDRFKKVNDSLGHLMGDQLLIHVSRRLQSCLRSGDTVARLGGDEFTILLDEISDKSEIFRIAERILKSLSLPFHLENHLLMTTCSIGVALSSSGYPQAEDMLRDADIAMYQAKAQGRSQYVIFDPKMHEKVQSLIALERDLLKSLENQDFRVYYQPIISLPQGELLGFEALIRWQHPSKGLLSPRTFLKVAQETGLLVPMSYWALQEACQQLMRWQKTFQLPWKMHVNLASQQFSIPDFHEQIALILEYTELPASALVLELTEDVLLKDSDAHLQTILALKELGLALYLDDFGTAYSSISSLYNFPIDAIKIDLRVTHATQNPRLNGPQSDLDFIKAMVSMARHMGLNYSIEGVENATQLALLLQENCPAAQGYFFSAPLPADATEALLKQKPNWLTGQLEAPFQGNQVSL